MFGTTLEPIGSMIFGPGPGPDDKNLFKPGPDPIGSTRYVKAKFSGVLADDVKLRRAVTNSLVYQRQKRKQADEHSQTKQRNNLISKNDEQKIAPTDSIDEQSEVEVGNENDNIA
ncbi:unnamed protein product [Didymodactylos carnosus]|uniref:Uncharacterized protein n=1 Tax=Didymodactylos carnosus TaxID=1234261 RepID=A0A8S2KDC4_9BILA|nr:unnamed protein product [Didymodactylos carnosus]CAF3847994.1 unnamed protein product [Didymodactylos carnosus]